TFEDVTAEAGLQVEMYGMGCSAGDYDNDGDEDLYVACLGPNHLYRNEGNGTFIDVTRETGVGDPAWSVSSVWLDYDRDGDLDLFVANYLKWSPERDDWLDAEMGQMAYAPQLYDGDRPRLYRNDGDGFTDVSDRAGIRKKVGKGMSAVGFDSDGDGWTDIYMSNDTLPDFLYRNLGDGTFAEEGILAGVAFSAQGVAKSGMGVDAADVRNCGLPDIAVGSFANEMVSVFRNEGEGAYADVSVACGVGRPSSGHVTFGICFFDYDLDGRLDLFASAGHVESDIQRWKAHMTHAQRPLLFRNTGGGRFEEVGASAGDLARPLVGRGAAVADTDNDGDLDLLVSANNGRPSLLRNEGGNRNQSLRLRVIGTESNRSGIGTRISLRLGTATQTRMLKAGSSYCSDVERIATFGLGLENEAEDVEIAWPSGRVDRLGSLEAGQTVTVEEGHGIVHAVPFERNNASE
ncbi:MAG: CRTAC1 family protein, partial [Candidatus Latescibacteria bacterium]|nr:CRTAC1 family protein [Candidatus Latescibacterota bacterium]